MNQNILNHLDGNIGWKDIDLRHLGCNDNLANALNLQFPEEIIGLRDCDFFHSDQDSIFHFQKDQLALQGQTTKFVHLHYDKLYFVIKKPMLDLNKCIYGVIYQCQKLDDVDFFRKLINSDQPHSTNRTTVSYDINPDTNRYALSRRELQCMFYILRGKSNKQIAEALKLSKRTIDFYMENIKNKFGCQSKNELIIKAIDTGYSKIIV